MYLTNREIDVLLQELYAIIEFRNERERPEDQDISNIIDKLKAESRKRLGETLLRQARSLKNVAERSKGERTGAKR